MERFNFEKIRMIAETYFNTDVCVGKSEYHTQPHPVVKPAFAIHFQSLFIHVCLRKQKILLGFGI